MKAEPRNEDAIWSVAQSFGLLCQLDLANGEPEAAAENLRLAEQKYAALSANYQRDWRVRRERAALLVATADSAWKAGQRDESERLHRAALRERQALRKQGPNNPHLARDEALSRLSLGDLLVMRSEPARAWAEYRPVFDTFDTAARADPDNLNARRDLAAIHYRRGVLAPALAGPFLLAGQAAAAGHFAKCLALRRELAAVDQRDTQGQMELLLALARCGRADEAEKVSARLLRQAGDDRRILLQVACGLAVAGDGTGPAAGRCRNQCFQVLSALVDQGWQDRVGPETEPDLEILRGDKRFTTIVNRVQAAARAGEQADPEP